MDTEEITRADRSEPRKNMLEQQVLHLKRLKTKGSILFSRQRTLVFEIYDQNDELLGYLEESPRDTDGKILLKAERPLDFTIKTADGQALYKISRPRTFFTNNLTVSTMDGRVVGYCNQGFGLVSLPFKLYTVDVNEKEDLFAKFRARAIFSKFDIKDNNNTSIGEFHNNHESSSAHYFYGETFYKISIGAKPAKPAKPAKHGKRDEALDLSNKVDTTLSPEQMAVVLASVVGYQFMVLLTERVG